MNRIISLLILAICVSSAHAQQWAGFETGRFSGVSSANQRPAGMAPSPFKVDATLLGAHFNAAPENIFNKEIHKVALTGGFYGLAGFSELKSKTSVFTGMQGPSIMVQAHPKVALAFTWNTRNMWLSDMTEPGTARLFDPELENFDLVGDNETGNILYTGWNEFGLGAAGVIWDEGFHSISIGGFAKLVYGTGHMRITTTDMDIDANDAMIDHMDFTINAEITDRVPSIVDEGKLHFADKAGYGFDFGFEYKFLNPRSCPGSSNARAKVGIAVNDLGKAFYNSATRYTKDNATADNIARSVFHGSFEHTVDTLADIFELNETVVSNYSVSLPMSLRVYAEVNIRRRAVIYGEAQFVMAQMTHPDLPAYFRFNVTPRFEDDRFGIYLPLTATTYNPFDAGLAIRMKPLIIGSGNLFSFWAYDDRGGAMDFYVMLKIPILNDDERIDWKTMNSRMKTMRRR